jgi:diguanylate cyclase (GGDEF)-like protein
MKLLIAEDQAPSAFYLRHTLEKMGHEITVAPDGEQAWRVLQSENPPLLISDWMMPLLDGPALCRRIRSNSADRYTYIILLTSRDRKEDRLEGLRAGADDFLTKPPDSDELAVRLEIAERILKVHAQLARQNERLVELAAVDELTGTKNRRRFREDLDLLYAQAQRLGAPLSLIMLDLDHFKEYNDTFGHPAGDEVLQRLGSTLRSSLRSHDVVARYGGEEFVVLLPATDEREAMDVAERLRRSIASGAWPRRQVTASLGVGTIGPRTSSASALVEHADRAMYQSKQAGRNRVTHHRSCGPLAVAVEIPFA